MPVYNIYLEFLDYLNAIGICYAILHDWELVVQGKVSDLDLVVARDDLQRLEAALHQQYRILTMFHYEASSFGFVLAAKDRDAASFLIADFTTDYRWRGRIFFTDEELLQERRQWRSFWVVGLRQEFAYLLVKKIYEKGTVPAHQRVRLKELMQELDQEAHTVVSRLFGEVWEKKVIDWVGRERWLELEASIEPLRRSLRRQVVKRNPLNPLCYWLPELQRLWRRMCYPTGFFIAILGPDGAGKSTLVHHIEATFLRAFRRTALFHLRPGVMGWKGANGPVTDPHAKPPHPLWLSLLKVPYYLLDYSLGYLIKLLLKLVRSTLVLFDRYYDDLLVDPRRYRYGGPQWLIRLARCVIPKPDLFLILDASEDQLLLRKCEVSPEELRRQRAAYWRLAMEVSNAVLLDGSLPADEVARNASEVLLEFLHERYCKRRHLWFHDDPETLNWLSSVICSPESVICSPESVICSPEEVRLALLTPAQHSPETPWQINNSFGWLALKDGRGFLIPLTSQQTRVNALRLYNAQNRKARIAKKLLTLSLKGNMVRPLVRKVQVLIRQDVPKEERSKILLLEHLKGVLGSQDLTYAISLGTPGPHRKPVVQIMTSDGKVVGYAKVGRDDATNRLVQNEVQTLQVLAAAHLHVLTVPHVLHSGWWRDHFLGVLSAPEGVSDRSRQTLTPLHLAALKELRATQMAWMPLQESAFWITLCWRVCQMHHTYYRYVLEQGIAKAEAWVGKTSLPFHFCHGDFTPWNMKQNGKKLFIFDWEYASEAGPPAWDLFHFQFKTMLLLKKWNACGIYALLVENDTFHRGKESALVDLGLEERYLKPFFLFYLLDRLAFHAATGSAPLSLLQTLSATVNLLVMK
jgi:thymidylate kinase